MCYFDLAFTNPIEVIDSICYQLDNPQLGKIDHIVGTGISGIMLLVPVSIKSEIQCCAVRKSPGYESSHSGATVEYGNRKRRIDRYVIIDDFIESGQTVNRIIALMNQHHPHSRCVCVIMYQQDRFKEFDLKYTEIPVITLYESVHELINMRKKT